MERSQNLLAARALMPLVLEDLCHYCDECSVVVSDLRQVLVSAVEGVEIVSRADDVKLPRFDETTIATLKEFVQSANRQESIAAAQLIREVQDQLAHLRAFVAQCQANPRFGPDSSVSQKDADEQIFRAACLQASAEKWLPYTRGMTPSTPGPAEAVDVITALEAWQFSPSTHPVVRQCLLAKFPEAAQLPVFMHSGERC